MNLYMYTVQSLLLNLSVNKHWQADLFMLIRGREYKHNWSVYLRQPVDNIDLPEFHNVSL